MDRKVSESSNPKAGAPTRRRRVVDSLRSWTTSLVLAVVILAPLRSAVADWNDVPSGSMEPTILPGDRIFVNKLAYGLRVPFTRQWVARWSDPSPGDVVILFSPKDGTRLVKRVIARPGDTLALRNNALLINGVPSAYSPLSAAELTQIDPAIRAMGGAVLAEERLGGSGGAAGAGGAGGASPHVVMSMPALPSPRTFGPVTVPAAHYFVMGDNRDNSADSRYFGFVPEGDIVGRSPAVVLSVDPQRWYRPRWGRFFSVLR